MGVYKPTIESSKLFHLLLELFLVYVPFIGGLPLVGGLFLDVTVETRHFL